MSLFLHSLFCFISLSLSPMSQKLQSVLYSHHPISALLCKFQHVVLPGLKTISSALGFLWVLTGLLLPALKSEDSLKVEAWGNHRAQLIRFPSLRDHHPLFFDSQCLLNFCFQYLLRRFSCFREQSKSIACQSISARSPISFPRHIFLWDQRQ